jgi:glycosyltransferase involved in cell wall biosynthesis
MKILAISYALPPMLYPQAIQIGRLLSHSKLDVCAISGGYKVDLSDFGRRVTHHIVPFENEPKGALHSIGIRVAPFYGTVPDAFRAWTNLAYVAVGDIVRKQGKPDLIVTFGEPMSDHVLGVLLKRELGVPWLAHFSDPWSDNPFRVFQPLSKFVNRALERIVIETADRTVFTSEETVDLVYRKYNPFLRERVSVLPHSFDPDAYAGGQDDNQSGKIVLRYIGNFYGHRSPRPLIAALAHIFREAPDILADVTVELVGGIPRRMLRSSEWKVLPEGLLVARGSVSYAQSLQLMRASDILLTIDAPATKSVFFPSKLAEYIGAGRRLVGIVPPGAASRIISECGGKSVSPTAPVPEVANLLRDEIDAARSKRGNGVARLSPGQNATRYDIANVAPMFDALCRLTVESTQRLGVPS